MNPTEQYRKILFLLEKSTRRYTLSSWVIMKGKLFYATWDENHHNGDIENYKETEVKKTDNRLPGLLYDLEKEIKKELLEADKKQRGDRLLQDFYQRHFENTTSVVGGSG